MIIDFSLGYFWCPLSKSVPYALRVVGVVALYINYELLFRSFSVIISKLDCFAVVMNLVTTHYNCTSPMDYISHHALHTHIPVHHYTNHTAVTIHSLVLIASPHLHLILTLTFKQHSHLHSLRSLVLPWLTFPSIFPCVYYLDR